MSERTHPVPNDIVEFFKRHLVPLHVSYAKGGDSKHEVYSAFLIDIAEYWWLVTAGHCVEEIESMHAITPLSQRPECFSESTVPRFYGRISLGDPLTHIRGLSGGPILGFREVDGKLRYWLHAIQSGWNPGTREISACFVGPFAMYVEETVLGVEAEISAGPR